MRPFADDLIFVAFGYGSMVVASPGRFFTLSTSTMAKILLVEDDKDLAENVEDWLKHETYVVEVAHTAELAAELLATFYYDLLILDWNLPGLSGIDLIKTYRANGGLTSVLMITGKETIKDKEVGLDAGADDYLTKPFHLRELSARVRALLRRPRNTHTAVLTGGDIALDTATRQVSRAGQPIDLMPKEYALLEFFLRHPNQVFAQEAIIDHLWHSEKGVGVETVRTNIMRLRKKIDGDSEDSLIKNLRGHGYKLELPEK
jgi:DNA-binding response OmpR family regulator